ncbi:MAG TPA: hypothetical protein EYP53_03235 [Candidatus Latescibacteria bacterium]|nr:hypothetical protein [Candidatus Latescibacterota bacterium]
MGELQQRMEERLKLEGYSYRTRKTYLQHMRRFVAYHRKDPRQLAASDIQRYLLYLLDEKRVSHSYVNQAVSAIKYFYSQVLKQPVKIAGFPRPKKAKKLPVVLSEKDITHCEVGRRSWRMLSSAPGFRRKPLLIPCVTVLPLIFWSTVLIFATFRSF